MPAKDQNAGNKPFLLHRKSEHFGAMMKQYCNACFYSV
jgi:hypothetical protein